MKLLFVINCLNFGGAERMLVRLLATNTFDGDDITVVVLQLVICLMSCDLLDIKSPI